MTTDIDVAVRGDSLELEPLVATLEKHRIVARIPEAVPFARAHLVLLLRHQPTGVDIDLSFAWTTFEYEALAACQRVRYGGVDVPLARAEDLVIYKVVAGRPRDIEDARALLLLHDDVDLVRIRERVRELAALADAPELERALRAVIVTTRPERQVRTQRMAKKATKKRRR